MIIGAKKLTIVLALITMSVSINGFSMGFFGLFAKKETIVVFAGMEGRILLNDQPAANANVTLWTKWNSPEGDKVKVKTDEQGRFSLPQQTGEHKQSAFSQLVITQQITINYQGNDYLIWNFSSLSPIDEGSLGYQPQNLTCELSDERKPYEQASMTLFTSCKWDGAHLLSHA